MLSDHTLAAQFVAGNDDLLTEILLRLPIRSLLRFKSVSKHWLSLISNPTFSLLRNYCTCSPNPPISGLLLRRPSRRNNPKFDFVPVNDDDPEAKPPFRSLNFVNDPCGIVILQSCNGLLLCWCANECFTVKSNYYYIYNPTTNKFTTLPDPNRRVFSVNIAFDPSKSPHYKAVCVYSSESKSETLPFDYHLEIEIYSSETGLWTPSGDPFDAEVDFDYTVYWNGSIHWISIWGDSLYFNLNTQRLGTMPIPPVRHSLDEVRNPFVGESGGHLHLLALHGLPTAHFNIYEMEIDYSNWFVKYNVDLDSVPSAFPEMICSSRDPLFRHGFIVMDVIRRDKDEDSFLVLQIPGKIIRYNFVDNTFNKLCDFIPDDGSTVVGSLYRWVVSFQYIESLASVLQQFHLNHFVTLL